MGSERDGVSRCTALLWLCKHRTRVAGHGGVGGNWSCTFWVFVDILDTVWIMVFVSLKRKKIQ